VKSKWQVQKRKRNKGTQSTSESMTTTIPIWGHLSCEMKNALEKKMENEA